MPGIPVHHHDHRAPPRLEATDVAARGLDVPGIDHIVNYDLPMDGWDAVTGRLCGMLVGHVLGIYIIYSCIVMCNVYMIFDMHAHMYYVFVCVSARFIDQAK